jgi:heme oxygenase (mycobilin-producing)
MNASRKANREVADAPVAARSGLEPGRVITIDLKTNPDLHFRLDNFSVPDEAREEFEQAMQRNLAFIGTLPGFLGHVAFEKSGGPTVFNVATIAVWESRQALDAAGVAVRDYYQKIGFDMPATLARLGIKAELGNFHALTAKS